MSNKYTHHYDDSQGTCQVRIADVEELALYDPKTLGNAVPRGFSTCHHCFVGIPALHYATKSCAQSKLLATSTGHCAVS